MTMAADREIVSTRIFKAPCAVVWKAWTDPKHLATWWGPKGFTNTFHEFDFRPGGIWKFTMHGPQGANYPNESRYIEIVRLKRLVFDHISAPTFHVTAIFEDLSDKTRLTWHMLFETAADYDKVKGFAIEANEENLDRLEAHLAVMQKSAA